MRVEPPWSVNTWDQVNKQIHNLIFHGNNNYARSRETRQILNTISKPGVILL